MRTCKSRHARWEVENGKEKKTGTQILHKIKGGGRQMKPET